MNLTVSPAQQFKGRVYLPASKSYSIRAFLIAACGGRSSIIAPSNCDDAIVAINAAKALGAKISKSNNRSFKVSAFSKQSRAFSINVGESGTVLRFLLPVVCLRSIRAIVSGTGTLRGRPNYHLLKTLRENGADIRGQGVKEGIPIRFLGGELGGGTITIDGSLSSQFISALLIACPQIKEDTHLILKGKELVSTDYIEMTTNILKQSGVVIKRKDARHYFIRGNQTFKGLKDFTVPSDYGLAAFLMASAALIKSDVVLDGYFNDKLIQADGRILTFLKKMGVKFNRTKISIKIKGPFKLRGGTFSLKDCPDLVPIMAVLALFAKGTTRLTDIGHARAKESDRISDLRKELLKTGARIEERSSALIIYPQPYYKNNVTFDPHHDHRLAMAFAVLGLKLGATIRDIECTHKSYPDFVQNFRNLQTTRG